MKLPLCCLAHKLWFGLIRGFGFCSALACFAAAFLTIYTPTIFSQKWGHQMPSSMATAIYAKYSTTSLAMSAFPTSSPVILMVNLQCHSNGDSLEAGVFIWLVHCSVPSLWNSIWVILGTQYVFAELKDRYCYYLPFTDEKTEIHRGQTLLQAAGLL